MYIMLVLVAQYAFWARYYYLLRKYTSMGRMEVALVILSLVPYFGLFVLALDLLNRERNVRIQHWKKLADIPGTTAVAEPKKRESVVLDFEEGRRRLRNLSPEQ